jgi:hypothetical protein
MPAAAVTLWIVADLFYLEGDTSGNEIGTVFADPDLLRITMGRRQFFFFAGHDVPASFFLAVNHIQFLIP